MSVATGRIATIDVVRGVAVCGILLMNIAAFAMPPAAYDNPRAWGGDSGVNLAVWAVNFVLVDGKMRGLFSFLFGASILLIADRAEANGENAGRVHYARMFWLLVLGLAHLWLVWWGDILHHYALIGSLAFLLRRLPNRAKLVIAMVLLSVQTVSYVSLASMMSDTEAALASNPDDERAAARLAEFNADFGVPAPETLARDIALHRRDYRTILADRWAEDAATPVQEVLAVGAETLAYMLMGMAALSSGLLTGAWPQRRYIWIALAGFAVTLPTYAALAWLAVRSGFDAAVIALTTLGASAPLRPIMIMAWACLIIALAKRGGGMVRRLEAAGRMAFSNYLASSLICTTLFYGYGLGWYGALQRWQLMLVVAAVWVLILAWSRPWLQHFRYGPAEWLWRSLARGRPQRFAGSALTESR